MATYHVLYLDRSGLQREAYAAGTTAAEAIRKVAACEPRYLRATRAIKS